MRAVFLYIILLFTLCSIAFSQDIIHTKSGSSFKGRIVEEFPNVQIVIQDIGGNRYTIAWDDIERIERGQWLGRKNPVVSWALSFFLLPGLGQFYNGDNGQGGTNLGLHVMALALVIGAEDRPQVAGAVIGTANWIWSFIDAPVRSKKINRERGYANHLKLNPHRILLAYEW
jgi:hypothetical protein